MLSRPPPILLFARSLAKLGYCPPRDSLAQLISASQALLPRSTPQDMALAAYSFAVLGVTPPEAWWVLFWGASGRTMDQASSQALANMFWAHGRLRKVRGAQRVGFCSLSGLVIGFSKHVVAMQQVVRVGRAVCVCVCVCLKEGGYVSSVPGAPVSGFEPRQTCSGHKADKKWWVHLSVFVCVWEGDRECE